MKGLNSVDNCSLPPRVLSQTLFDYVEKQSVGWQRAIAYYEYARESLILRTKVASTRKLLRQRGDLLEIQVIESEMPTSVTPEIGFLLVEMRSFPSKAFNFSDVPSHLMEYIEGSGIGVSRVAFIPWDVFFELRKMFALGLGAKQLNSAGLMDFTNQTYHVLAIPWGSTNRQLANQFRKLLEEYRPTSTPEPRRPGRAGASLSGSPIEMLHQLAAYRFEKMGYSYAKAQSWTVYTSPRGWRDAIASARQRISTLATEPLFGSSTRRRR